MKTALYLFLALLTPVFFAIAAEETTPKREVKIIKKYKKVTELDFEDSLIKGKLIRPDGDLLLHRNKTSEDNWLHLRESFKDRVTQSARSLK